MTKKNPGDMPDLPTPDPRRPWEKGRPKLDAVWLSGEGGLYISEDVVRYLLEAIPEEIMVDPRVYAMLNIINNHQHYLPDNKLLQTHTADGQYRKIAQKEDN